MKYLPGTLTLAGLVLCMTVGVMADEPLESKNLTEAINDFSHSLYQKLKEEQGNIVVSPLSVAVALGMVLEGLAGDSAEHVAAAIHLAELTYRAENFKELISSFKDSGIVTLEMANKIFVEKTFPIKPQFFHTTEKNFLSRSEQLDFKGETEFARKAINEWASNSTHGKITELIKEGTLSTSTIMALVNAIYFKGNWKSPFKEVHTRMEPFHKDSRSSKNVSMMHKSIRAEIGNISDLRASVLELPYKENRFSMMVYLPNRMEDFEHMESNLGTYSLDNIQSQLESAKVDVALPLFKIKTSLDIIPPLTALGMGEVFQPGADFSGLTDIKNVYITNAVQQAYINVNEAGTEAAAVTEIRYGPGSAIDFYYPIPFTADHPFIFMIVDQQKKIILFMGKVLEP